MRLSIACLRAVTAVLAATIGLAVPSDAATITAAVSASANKPLLLSKLQDLDLGSVTLNPGLWSNVTVGLSRTGILSCGSVNVTCSGATRVAQYNVQGSNQQIVRINVPNVTLINQSDVTQTLLLTTDKPASVTLTNSGAPGTNFAIGGSVTLNSTTVSGTYIGTFNVTADYQ